MPNDFGFFYPTHWAGLAEANALDLEVDDNTGMVKGSVFGKHFTSLLEERDRMLEDWINSHPHEIPWDAGGTTGTTGAYSPRAGVNRKVGGFTVAQATQGSSGNTVAKLWLNGSSGTLLATVTVAFNASYGRKGFTPVEVRGGTDTLVVQVTSIAVGADNVGGAIEFL